MSRFSLPKWVPSADNPALMDQAEIEIARERSRRGAAMILMENPQKKAEVEAVYGIEYCRQRYPEAYQNTNAGFIRNFVDWVTER